jgi:simple sugar transport system ATP-binding protein
MKPVFNPSPIENVVMMQGIWKSFPGVIANQRVDFTLRRGEIHALLGENGAGKTTLMRILAGEYRCDAGSIWVNGRLCDFRSPADALAVGIGMVHQHFRLVHELTVAENIHLGYRPMPLWVRTVDLRERTLRFANQFGVRVPPDEKVGDLSVGEQQKVEILKVLARGVKVLLLDEPTAVLTPQEASDLFATMGALVDRGCSIVFISHKLEEVLSISRRITVLRQGQIVGRCDTADSSVRGLARMMVGEDLVPVSNARSRSHSAAVVLRLIGVTALDDLGLPALQGINLAVHEGEIIGVAGVSGNGQTELAEVVGGMRAVQTGTIEIAGSDFTGRGAGSRAEAGVGHIPEERLGVGLISSMSVTHNAMIRTYKHPPISKGIRLDMNQARKYAEGLVARADVRAHSVQAIIQQLSGGNQQRLLAQREIETATKLLLAVHPTRGLDVAATAELRKRIIDHRDGGGAILLISEDLDEILMLADRIVVMYEGKLVGEMTAAGADREELGLLMGGAISTARAGI